MRRENKYDSINKKYPTGNVTGITTPYILKGREKTTHLYKEGI